MNHIDLYSASLGKGFESAYTKQFGRQPYTESYRTPDAALNGMSRNDFMTKQFSAMHADLCQEKPQAIFFGGRGKDLLSFLDALAQGSVILPLVRAGAAASRVRRSTVSASCEAKGRG